MRSIALVVLALALLAAPVLADVEDAITQDPCPGASPPALFAQLDEQTENMAFDGQGHLYVTTIQGGLWRFTPDGAGVRLLDADRPLGGAAFGPDGALYVGHSVGIGVPLPVPDAGIPLLVESGKAEVWRFDALPSPDHTSYATGLNSANGLAIDAAGNVYVSSGFEQEIWRVAPDGTKAVWTTTLYANGLALAPGGQHLFAALLLDPGSSVVRIPLAEPEAAATEVQFSAGLVQPEPFEVHVLPHPEAPLLPKGLDDLAVDPRGRHLYVTGHLSNEVLRADLRDHTTCVQAAEVPEATSARFATGFGAWDGKLFVTNFGGSIQVLEVP